MSKSFKVGNKMDIKSSHKMMNNHQQNSYQNPSNNKTYTIKSSNKTNKHKKTGIDIKKAYKIKPSKIWVDCGVRLIHIILYLIMIYKLSIIYNINIKIIYIEYP